MSVDIEQVEMALTDVDAGGRSVTVTRWPNRKGYDISFSEEINDKMFHSSVSVSASHLSHLLAALIKLKAIYPAIVSDQETK